VILTRGRYGTILDEPNWLTVDRAAAHIEAGASSRVAAYATAK
jgi:hypothetical protein